MAEHSIPEVGLTGGLEKDVDWEAHYYAEGCELARRQTESYFQGLDKQFYEQCPAGWEVIGFRERQLMTRYGEVTVRRRLYRDETGRGRILLDEYLKLPARQVATPSMQRAVVALAGDVGFEKVAQHLAGLTAAVLSTSTVWRTVQRVGRAALAQEAQEGVAVYQQGQLPRQAGTRVTERLFVEADGVYVRLQQAERSHLEIKSAIAYTGWERLGGELERYRLKDKRVYVHGVSNLAFWEGAGLAWSHHWDCSRVEQVVVGGDGAAWIDAGSEWIAHSIRQLDGFHLARATGRACGKDHGRLLYDAIRSGNFTAADTIWQQAPKRKHKSAKRDIRWLEKLLIAQQGQDWRSQIGLATSLQRSLGAMEGNGAHLIADRMKGKGRSWSRRGALHMAKIRELILNEELLNWGWRIPHSTTTHAPPIQHPKRRKPRNRSGWLQASVPALHGPHNQRPWARRLKSQIHSTY